MNPLATAEELAPYLTRQLSELTAYSHTNQCPVSGIPANEFLQVSNPADPFEFTCLGNSFIIKKHYFHFDGMAYLRTYEILPNELDYPKKIAQHMPEMDIYTALPLGSLLRFLYPIKPNIQGTSALAAQMNSVDTGAIKNFGEQYMRQLYKVIEIKYKHPD